MAKAAKTSKANLILEVIGLRALIWGLEGQSMERFDALDQHDNLCLMTASAIEDVYEVLRLRLLDLCGRDVPKNTAH